MLFWYKGKLWLPTRTNTLIWVDQKRPTDERWIQVVNASCLLHRKNDCVGPWWGIFYILTKVLNYNVKIRTSGTLDLIWKFDFTLKKVNARIYITVKIIDRETRQRKRKVAEHYDQQMRLTPAHNNQVQVYRITEAATFGIHPYCYRSSEHGGRAYCLTIPIIC